jgi:hypothetical protein
VSQACGERVLFPAVRNAGDDLGRRPRLQLRHQIAGEDADACLRFASHAVRDIGLQDAKMLRSLLPHEPLASW